MRPGHTIIISMDKTYSGKIIICVDDTDDLTKDTSTGRIAEAVMRVVDVLGCRILQGITRHQLLIHEKIDYTSHNSAMCFAAKATGIEIKKIIDASELVIRKQMAASSNPGLCVCMIEELRDPEKLIAFGKRAQTELILKEEAYKTAAAVGGTVLREYGGTGAGVIGALAGAGLRLSGCDGLFRGSKQYGPGTQIKNAAEWKKLLRIEKIFDTDGTELDDTAVIELDGKIKLALLEHKPALIVKRQGGIYAACSKNDLMNGSRKRNVWNSSCPYFSLDNDIEECLSEGERACFNCLYRRWTADGFQCVREAGADA